MYHKILGNIFHEIMSNFLISDLFVTSVIEFETFNISMIRGDNKH